MKTNKPLKAFSIIQIIWLISIALFSFFGFVGAFAQSISQPIFWLYGTLIYSTIFALICLFMIFCFFTIFELVNMPQFNKHKIWFTIVPFSILVLFIIQLILWFLLKNQPLLYNAIKTFISLSYLAIAIYSIYLYVDILIKPRKKV